MANPTRTVQVHNNSGSLGRLLSADLLALDRGAEHLFTVWEFGRAAIWDLSSSHAAIELGDLKLGSGRIGGCWAVRREAGKAQVLALLSRSGAQDVLSLFLPPSTTPFKSTTLPTVDAQSLAWSGSWLSILDTPLAAPGPALLVLTPDGNLFRSFPAASSPDEDVGLMGPKALAWATDYLALSDSAEASVTLLSTRTFTPSYVLSPALVPADFCHVESVSAAGVRTHRLVAASAIPLPTGGWNAFGSVVEMKWNALGTRLAARFENAPTTLFVWEVPAPPKERGLVIEAIRPPMMVVFHGGIRNLIWHSSTESLLMAKSEEEAEVCLLDTGIESAPLGLDHALKKFKSSETGRLEIGFVSENLQGEKLRVVVSSRRKGWCMIYPEGRDQDVDDSMTRTLRRSGQEAVLGPGVDQSARGGANEEEEGDVTQDSLFDILTGRTPLPELGSGRIVDEGNVDEEMGGLEDTFREKNKKKEEEDAVGGTDGSKRDSAEAWDDEVF